LSRSYNKKERKEKSNYAKYLKKSNCVEKLKFLVLEGEAPKNLYKRLKQEKDKEKIEKDNEK
jgi:hypothetical protein